MPLTGTEDRQARIRLAELERTQRAIEGRLGFELALRSTGGPQADERIARARAELAACRAEQDRLREAVGHDR
jgi:hypothetical protein